MTGNFDVLLANVVILAASSIESTVGHHAKSRGSYTVAILLGVWFCLNQVAELNSFLSVFSVEHISLVLASLVTHLSHLILSLLLFVKVFVIDGTTRSSKDLTGNFVATYWHLVEIVWIVILGAMFTA